MEFLAREEKKLVQLVFSSYVFKYFHTKLHTYSNSKDLGTDLYSQMETFLKAYKTVIKRIYSLRTSLY